MEMERTANNPTSTISKRAQDAEEKAQALQKLQSGEWKTEDKQGKVTSAAWNRFSQIVERDTKAYTGFVQFKGCSLIKKFAKNAGIPSELGPRGKRSSWAFAKRRISDSVS